MTDTMELSKPAKNSSNSSSDVNIALIKRLKIAVATAIIRNKPLNVSVKEYTENLARRLKQKESDWRCTVRRLEDELLAMRQELTLARLRDAGVGLQIDRDFSWDNDNKALEPLDKTKEEPSESVSDFDFLTPPCSSDDNIHINQLEMTLRNNAQFLHSISQLKAIPECNAKNVNQTALDTAVNAIQCVEDYVVKNCHGPWNHGRLLKDGVKGVVRLIECSNVGECQTLLESCDRLISSLLTSLVEYAELNNNEYQQNLCQLLTILGRTAKLQVTTLRHVLHHLQVTSTALRSTQERKQDLDHVLFENAFYLCSIFEDVLFVHPSDRVLSREYGQLTSRLKSDIISELHAKLDDCLLHICDEYPLYAQFIWRLTGALECIQVD